MADFFITGVSKGIGLELLRELVRRGHRVWGVARNAEALDALRAELGAESFFPSVCDVGDEGQVEATLAAMRVARFVPGTVILNAGISCEQYGDAFDFGRFRAVVETNLYGALWWVEAFLPDFVERKGGHFVAISSMAALRGDARWVGYPASKAALSRSFESLRGRHGRAGVKFTIIHLGQVETGAGVTRSPLRLTKKKAALKILEAMEYRRGSVTIPWILRLVVAATRILPDVVFSRLILRALTESGSGEKK